MPDNEAAIEYGDLIDHTGYHIRRAHSTFTRLFAAYGKEFNIRSQQTSILVLTRENPGISPASIADAIEIERSLMTKLLADLKSRGFIETRACKNDGRQKGLYITPSGRQYAESVMGVFREQLEPELTRNLSGKERATLIRLLAKLYARQ